MVLPRAPFGSLTAHMAGLLNGRSSSQKTSDFKSNEFITQSDDSSASSDSDASDEDDFMEKLQKPAASASSSATRETNGEKARPLNKQAPATKIAEKSTASPTRKPTTATIPPRALKKEPIVKKEPDTGGGLDFSSSEEDSSSDDDEMDGSRLSPPKALAGNQTPRGITQKPIVKKNLGAKEDTMTNQPPTSAQDDDDSISESSSDSSEDDDEEVGPAGARTAPKPSVSAQYESETSSSGSESEGESNVSGSSSESEEEERSPKKISHPRANPPPPAPRPKGNQQGTKPSALVTTRADSDSGSDTSESESSDEEDLAAPPPPQPRLSKPQPAPTTSTSSSASEKGAQKLGGSSDDTDTTSSSEEEDDSDSDVEMADHSFAMATREPAERQALHNMIPAGFEIRKADPENGAADVTRMFRDAKTEGKQLWYFTAPASVPITVVEKMEIPLERAKQGLSILTHDGQDYAMSFEGGPTSTTVKLLIPHKGGDKYSMLNRGVDQTMHLKRVTKLPGDEPQDSGSKAPSRVNAVKAPRPQPPGLRNRFLPIGVNGLSNPASRAATAAERPSSQVVETVDGSESPKKSKKRKHETEMDEDIAARKITNSRESSPKKVKTAKTNGSGPASSSQLDASTPMKSAIHTPGPRPAKTVSIFGETRVLPPLPRGPPSVASTQPLPPKTKAASSVSSHSSSQPAKQTEVPLPGYARRPGPVPPTFSDLTKVSQSSRSPSEPRQPSPSKEAKKDKKGKHQKKEKAAKLGSSQTEVPVPRKETPVPIPHFKR